MMSRWLWIGLPLTTARRWPRPRATLAPGRFARFQRLSLALSYLVLARRPRAHSSLLLWFVVFPLPLVKGKHSKPSKETP